MEYLIRLNSIKLVKDFENEVLRIDSDAYIKSRNGRYSVDAKSIMGIFSLDLLRDLILEIDGEEKEFVEKLKDMEIIVGVLE